MNYVELDRESEHHDVAIFAELCTDDFFDGGGTGDDDDDDNFVTCHAPSVLVINLHFKVLETLAFDCNLPDASTLLRKAKKAMIQAQKAAFPTSESGRQDQRTEMFWMKRNVPFIYYIISPLSF